MTSSFYEHYYASIKKHGGILSYVEHKRSGSQGKLLNFILKEYPVKDEQPPIKVLDIGSGVGVLSYFLTTAGYEVLSLDIDKKMIAFQNDLMQVSKVFWPVANSDLSLIRNVYKPKNFNLCVSLGVMEHFQKEQIIRYLTDQLFVANNVIFSVPSPYLADEYIKRSAGDELFLNIRGWISLLKNIKTATKVNCTGLLFGKSSRFKIPDWVGDNELTSKLLSNWAAFYIFKIQ